MSDILRLKLELERPLGENERGYEQHEDLAELKVEIPAELAWELYRHCISRISEPLLKVAEPV